MTVINSTLGVLLMLIGFALVFSVINLYMLDIWTRELEEEAEYEQVQR